MLSLLLSWRLAFGASLKNIQKFTRTSATIYAGTKNFLASQRIGPATEPAAETPDMPLPTRTNRRTPGRVLG